MRIISKHAIQHASNKIAVKGESFQDEQVKAVPLDRMPSLTEIVSMFVQGRPIDSSLERHLEYNDFEGNPVLEKGFDLADYSRVAKANKATLEQINDEIEAARLAKKDNVDVLNDPSVTAPTSVATE